MRFIHLLFLIAMSCVPLLGQFEQKLSLNLSAGAFNTVGPSDYLPEGVSQGGKHDPTLMSNFGLGISFSASLQYNLSRHLSLEVAFGYMSSSFWFYDYSDEQSEPFSYLYYEIYTDTVNYITQQKGDNELYLTTYYLSVGPKYYFRPESKFNPYLFAGFNFTTIDVHFMNLEYEAYKELGRVDEYGPFAPHPWHDYTEDFGFYAGAGVEYVLGENLGIFLQGRYHSVMLDETKFARERDHSNYHSLELHLGARLSFLKSKEL